MESTPVNAPMPRPRLYSRSLHLEWIIGGVLALVCAHFVAMGKATWVLGALFELILLFMVFREPAWGIAFWACVAPAFQTYSGPALSGNPMAIAANMLHMLFIPMLGSIVLLQCLARKRQLRPIGVTEWAMIAFFAYSMASIALSLNRIGLSIQLKMLTGLYEVLRGYYLIYILPFVMYLVARHSLTDARRVSYLVRAMMLLSVFLTFVGIYEHYTGISWWTEVLYWRDIGIGRVAGPFSNPVPFGIALASAMLYVVHGMMQNTGWSQKRHFFSVFAAPAALYFTYTRSVWLSLPITGILVFILYPRSRRLVAGVLGFLILFIIFSWGKIERSVTFNQRIMNRSAVAERKHLYRVQIDMIKVKPVFGYGLGTYDYEARRFIDRSGGRPINHFSNIYTTSHSTYLTIILNLGFAGFGLLMLVVISVIVRAWRIRRKIPSDTYYGRELLATTIGCLVIFGINALFVDMRFFSYSYCFLGVSLGLLAALVDSTEDKINASHRSRNSLEATA